VLPANGAEAADTITLIEQEESAQGNDVAGVSSDGALFNGPVLRALSDPAGLNLDVTVPPTERPAGTKFGVERFALNVVGELAELTCPAGQTTRLREQVPEGYKYRFDAQQCVGCALREECLQKPDGGGGRSVIKNEFAPEYEKAKAKALTPEYAKTRKEHPRIERKLADLTRNHGARRAVYRGLWKVRIQAFMTAMVVNVKRMIRLKQMSSEVAVAVACGIAVRLEVG